MDAARLRLPGGDLPRLLDQSGIEFGVIAAASLFGTHSDYTIGALKAHPRLRGTVIVEPTVRFETLRAMRDCGVVGIRCNGSTSIPCRTCAASTIAP